jgi:hypothetical protein
MARERITVAAIAAASVILAGCSSASSGTGSSGAPGSSRSSSSFPGSDIASLPAEQIVSKAIASLRSAKSFRVAGTVVEGATAPIST